MNHSTLFNIYSTYPHKCGYLSNQSATTAFVDPTLPKSNLLYDKLCQEGFRRSGEQIYRPKCRQCQACISVRLPVQQFTPRRSQRRVWQKNQDLTVLAATPIFEPQHFNLYCSYLKTRHKNGGMDNPTPNGYMQFLTSTWSHTVFHEFKLEKQLLAIAVVDYLHNGLSAVYTFFDPEYSARSLGVYAILWQIETAKRLNLNWVYLGYWIKDCQKMDYKIEYQPMEYFSNGKWIPLEK